MRRQQGRVGMGSHKHGVSGHAGPSPKSRMWLKLLAKHQEALRRRRFRHREYFGSVFARDAGLRIHHLLLSPSLKGRLVAGGVAREVRSWEKTSDHAPAWIELKDVAPIRFRKKARD
jgi:exonuclease III